MKTSRSILSGVLTLVAVAGAAVLTSCSKDGFRTGTGKAVKFTTTSYGTSATKTYYGEDSGSKQTIPWSSTDVIRIASPTATVTKTAVGQSDQYWADYNVVPTAEGSSKATVTNYGSNGLEWGDDETYTFYAIYPAPIGDNASLPIALSPTDGKVTATLPASQELGSTSAKYIKVTTDEETGKNVITTGSEDDCTYSYTVYEPDMNYAYMTAVAEDCENNSERSVPLTFYPAFTAYEFNITSAEDEMVITQVQLVSTGANDYLAGGFSLVAGADLSTVELAESGLSQTLTLATTNSGATESGSDTGTQTTSNSGVKVTAEQGATFTLFGLPKDNTSALKLRVTIKDNNGIEDTAFITLTYATAGTDLGATTTHEAGAPVIFKAGQKYRINLLKIGNQWKYAIEIDPLVLPWTGVEEETSFSENVQAKAFNITGSLENTDEWRDTEGLRLNTLAGKPWASSNHYESFDTASSSYYDYETYMGLPAEEKEAYNTSHSTFYELYYQQRHLLVKGVSNPHFEVTFTPMAPLAGYWTLIPESVGDKGGVEGFQFKIWDGEGWQSSGWNTGQIMGTEVRIGIWPAEDSDTGTEYAMIMKAVF
ncbi:MAG: hypothetical protein IJ584_14680, partial [Bacteroidales bacterium]|nr:hypothetical protein [Bacteroidales bacterium]